MEIFPSPPPPFLSFSVPTPHLSLFFILEQEHLFREPYERLQEAYNVPLAPVAPVLTILDVCGVRSRGGSTGMLESGHAWLLVLLVVAIAVIPDLAISYAFRAFYPQAWQVVCPFVAPFRALPCAHACAVPTRAHTCVSKCVGAPVGVWCVAATPKLPQPVLFARATPARARACITA